MAASLCVRASRLISLRRAAFRSTRTGFSGTIRNWTTRRLAGSPLRRQGLAAGAHRFRRDKRECDHARHLTFVYPVMDGAALHQHVTGLEMHSSGVELHVDLAGHHHRIVDRIGAMIARRNAGAETDHAEHRAAGDRGADFLAGGIGVAVVVDREAFARPDDAVKGAGPVRKDVLDLLVDQHFGAALIVVAGDDAADGEAHGNVLPFAGYAEAVRFLPASRQSRNSPEPTTIDDPASNVADGTSPQNTKPRIIAQTSVK